MKILMVNKFLYPNGGSETYLFKTGAWLARMGHEVQYFGMEHPERTVGNRIQSYTASMDFHTGRLRKILYPFKIIYSLEARKKMRKVLEDFCPDVVHLNNFNFQLTPSIIYEIRNFSKVKGKKIGILYTAHDYQWICPNHMLQIPERGELCTRCAGGKYGNCTKYKCIHNSKLKSLLGTMEAELYKRLGTYRLVDVIVCPSRFMERMLAGNPALKGRTVMMHNFIDRGEKAAEKKEKKEAGKYVLYFGRYTEEKGVRTLAEVCRMLPEIPFVCAGSGPLEEELKAIPNIHVKGFLRGRELQEVIENARFVVFPSQWYENCPFSVMEAQMYGTPVLGSDLGGTPELIQAGVTGELFESGNVQELKNKISRLWQQEELCREYAGNCRSLPFDSLEEYCGKLLKIYAKLC